MTAAYHWNGSCIALPLTAPETILGEIPEIAHFKTRFAAWRLEGDCCFLLSSWAAANVLPRQRRAAGPGRPVVWCQRKLKNLNFRNIFQDFFLLLQDSGYSCERADRIVKDRHRTQMHREGPVYNAMYDETRPSKLCETQIFRLWVYLKNFHP